MVEAVIFDVDGTLVDSVDLHARAWQEALAVFGVDVPLDVVRGQIGKGGDQLLPVLVPAEILARIQAEIEALRGSLWERAYLPAVRPFPAVRALFERLARDGKRLAIASSSRARELARYERLLGVEDLVDARASADDADRTKPYPDVFEAALRALGGPPPGACPAVGDTPYDAVAAGAAGLRAVGLLCGGFDADWLREAGCVALYTDPQGLLRAYERLGDDAFDGARAETGAAAR